MHRPKLFLASLFMLAPLLVEAQDADRVRLAYREDDSHVLVHGESSYGNQIDVSRLGEPFPAPSAIRIPRHGLLRKLEPGPISIKPRDTYHRLGTRWQIALGGTRTVQATLESRLIDEGGDVEQISFLRLTIDAKDREAFRAVKEKYYLARPDDATMPWLIGKQANWIRDYAPLDKLREEKLRQFARTLTQDNARELYQNPSWVAPSESMSREFLLSAWKLASEGKGDLRYDYQAFQLAPDNRPRVFLRAKVKVSGKDVVFATAWLREEESYVLEWHAGDSANPVRYSIASGGTISLSDLGEILNVFSGEAVGVGRVLLYNPVDCPTLEAFTYSPDGEFSPIASDDYSNCEGD